MLNAPSGLVENWTNSFSWTGIYGATNYLLEVYDTGTNTQIHRLWYSPTVAGCTTDLSCAVSPVALVNLANGNYKWRIRDYGGYGYGPWTAYLTFQVNVPPAPVVTLVSPDGAQGVWTNTFSWNGIGAATNYLLEVYDTTSGAQLHRLWYSPTAAGCNTDLSCAVSPTALATLANGNYKWRIRDYGGYGYGPWTAYMTFTIP